MTNLEGSSEPSAETSPLPPFDGGQTAAKSASKLAWTRQKKS
jgi:hypothetical protein